LEINELKILADGWLTLAVNILKQGGRFSPLFDIVSATGHDTVGVNAEEKMDPLSAKNAAAAKVRETIREKHAFAVIHICDAATVVISNTHPQRALALGGRYSIEELERMGIGKRREAILVSLETPGYRRILKQYYDRIADGALIMQKRTDTDSNSPDWNGGAQGRFFDFFPKEKAAFVDR
jgi:hypothetical protein